MTREETQKILAIIGATYPNFKPEDKTATVDAWHFFLEDHAYSEISIALKTFVNMNGKGFPPSVDQLISMSHKTEELTEISEGEAWSLVHKAICKSGYYAEEEYEKLPPAIQKAVGSASQLHSWAIDDDFNASVISSQFLRSYRTVCEREKDLAHLPQEARARLENIQRIALEGK